MQNQITPFSAKDLASNMSDKIRQVVAQSIPEDAITQLIQNEIDGYFKQTSGHYGKTEDSQFTKLIRELVSKELSEKIKGEFDTLLQGYWINMGKPVFNEKMKQVVTELAPAFMENYFQSMVGSMIQSMQYNRPS